MRKRNKKHMKMLDFNKFQDYIFESRTPESVLKFNEKKVSLDEKPLTIKEVNQIFEADPSRNKSYVNWLVQLFTKTDYKMFFEDLYKATNYLTIFDKAKHKLSEERLRNIFNYKSLTELFDVIEPYLEDETKILSKRQLRGDTPVEGDYIYIDSTDEWDVVIPKTHKAACYWGSGTQWCTAVDSNPSYYNQYTKQGPLYIFRNKNKANERYQMHLQSKQFMDKSDRSTNASTFFNKHKELRDILVNYWKSNPDVLSMGDENPLLSLLDDNSSSNWSEILKMIVDSGFDLSKEDSKGNSAVIKVCSNLNENLLKYFIERGANVKKANKFNVTPMSAAVSADSRENDSDEITLRICKLLYEHGADASGSPTDSEHNGTTLISALGCKKHKTAMWLSDKEGYDINALDCPENNRASKNAALYLAGIVVNTKGKTQNGEMSAEDIQKLIKTLADRGLDLNKQTGLNALNRTALHHCAYFMGEKPGLYYTMKALLENGADPWIISRPKSITSNKSKSDKEEYLAIELLEQRCPNECTEAKELLLEYMHKTKPGVPVPGFDDVAPKTKAKAKAKEVAPEETNVVKRKPRAKKAE